MTNGPPDDGISRYGTTVVDERDILIWQNNLCMQRPYLWVTLMMLMSISSIAGTTTITVFTGGILSVPTAIALALFVTSIPMLVLLWLDQRGLRSRGQGWGRTRYLFYLLAVPLPSYVLTFLYLVMRSKLGRSSHSEEGPSERKDSTNDSSQREQPSSASASDILQGFADEYPSPNESNLSLGDLRALSDQEFSLLTAMLIENDFEDEGVESERIGYLSQMPAYIGWSENVLLFTCSCRPSGGTIHGLQQSVLQIAETIREAGVNPDFVLCFTDVRIERSIQDSIFSESGVLFIDGDLTRAGLRNWGLC